MTLSALPGRCSRRGFLYAARSLSLPPSLSLAFPASRSALFPIAGPSHRISVGHPPTFFFQDHLPSPVTFPLCLESFFLPNGCE